MIDSVFGTALEAIAIAAVIITVGALAIVAIGMITENIKNSKRDTHGTNRP